MSSAPSPSTVLEAFRGIEPPGTPLTTPEVAAEFDCTPRTIYNKLDALVDDGALETKKVGARGRVWWRPPTRPEHDGEDADWASEDERREAETRASESTFRELFDSVPGCYLIVDPDEYEIVAVNDAYLDATMTERDEILGRTLFEVFPIDPDDPDPEGVSRLRASLERVRADREADVMPVTHYPVPDRESDEGEFVDRWWSPINSPVFSATGDIDYIVHRVEDVTPVIERMRADGEGDPLRDHEPGESRLTTDITLRGRELHRAKERAYTEARERERERTAELAATRELQEISTRLIQEDDIDTLYDEILDAVVTVMDADFARLQLRDLDRGGLRLLADSGFEGTTSLWERVTPESNGPCSVAVEIGQRVVVSDVETCEFMAGTEDRETLLETGIRAVQSTPLVSRSGDVIGMLSTHWETPHEPSERDLRLLDVLARQATDLIENRRSEEALRESEARLDAFVTATSEVVYRMSPDWSEMYELNGQGFVADTEDPRPRETWLDEYIPPDERGRVQDAIEEAIETKSTFELEHQVVQTDGTTGWTHSRAVPLLDADGEITEWFGTATDITERKRREEELRETTEKLAVATTAGRIGLWTLDMETDVVSADEFIAETYGMDPDEVAAGTPLEEFFELVHEADHDRAWNAMERAKTETDELNVEHRVQNGEGNWIWADVRAKVEYDERGEKVRMNGAMIDITERKQREQLLKEQKELLELIATGASLEECLTALCAAVPRLGSDVRASIMLADDERESFQRPIAPDLHPSWREELEDAPINDLMISTCGEAVFRGDSVTCEDVTTDDGWSEEWRELCVANDVLAGHSEAIRDADGEPVGSFMLCFDEPRTPNEWERRLTDFAIHIAGIAVERQQSRQALKQTNESLERLTDTSRELMEASTDEISDRAAELAGTVLDVDYAVLWRYDGTTGEFRRHADHARDEAIGPLDDGVDRAWRAFIDDEILVENDVQDPEAATGNGDERSSARPASPLRSHVLVPLGEYGILRAGSTRPGRFDERTVDLAETLAATLETAWNRASSEQRLTRQNEELARLDRLNGLIRRIDEALVEADSVAAIDRAVCDRLAESDRYAFAWIGDRDPATETIRPREWTGVDYGFVDELAVPTDGGAADRNPVAAAVRTRETQVIPDVATETRFAPLREATLERGARSCIAVPLVYDGSLHGVLTVYPDRPRPDERDHAVLSELGRTIAHAIDAVETRQTLHTDRVVELTLGARKSNTPLCRLARETGATIEFEGFVHQADREPDVFFTASGPPTEELCAAGERSNAIAELLPITDRADETLFRARSTEPTLVARIVERNAVVRSLAIEDGEVTVVVDVPHAANVREFVERLQRDVPSVELLARRARDCSLETRRTFRTTYEERLTEKQLAALRTAYFSGFFESPRASTGREVAASLEVTQPTFTEHLRAAQREMYGILFEDDPPEAIEAATVTRGRDSR